MQQHMAVICMVISNIYEIEKENNLSLSVIIVVVLIYKHEL